ncbi:hypothetical protein CEXT_321881 [Caerostris extrusa]|uniref:Uncharacterized protein n=1 Tax=Caerostris extrusa TaxID=172846 RepID=A0AAV4V3S0_CAEEX|nr:hypothetical protein CEXT_321881 [Caerostris extrusa]
MRRGPCFLPAKMRQIIKEVSPLPQIAVDPCWPRRSSGSLIDLVPIFSSSPIPIISIFVQYTKLRLILMIWWGLPRFRYFGQIVQECFIFVINQFP